MAGRLTLWGAGQLLNNFFTGGSTLPEEFFLSLCTDTAPSPYVSGSELSEPLVGSYERLMIPGSSRYWSNASAPQILAMVRDMSFPTAMENWGRLRYWALCDSPGGGGVYAFGDMNPISVTVGETVNVFSGDLTIEIGPFFRSQGT